ncbi:MAG: hypothetical protein GX567_08080, partial [Clostridia bacterium]|nr:hypothetical protein [Clostridia bacterium]
MEWILLFGCLFVGILVIFIRGALYDRKQFKKFLLSLDEDYGVFSKREYTEDEMSNIAAYFYYKAQNEDSIDDITWNDLDMDRVFQKINTTMSSAGDEYLYAMLRNPLHDETQLKSRDELIEFIQENPDVRKKLQIELHKLGRIRNKMSLTTCLLWLDELKRESNLFHYLLNAVLVITFALIFISPAWGTLAFIVAMCVAIITYYKRKSLIAPYILSFSFVAQMLHFTDKLAAMKCDGMKTYAAALKEQKKGLETFQKNMYALNVGTKTTENPLELVMDYARMIFHVDIIKFNSMLQVLQEKNDQIFEIKNLIGQIDSAIAVASYRKAVDFYCKPEFLQPKEGRTPMLKGIELYHPLIEQPVTNTIDAKKGALITGSNASGKSTFLKTVAINAILAQTIDTVLAHSYQADLFYLYSSMALKDDLMSHESYYIVEIKSLKRILDAEKEKGPILCFVDEVLRGTNTVERIAASSKILQSFAENGVLCFAATHDIELSKILSRFYDNYHFEEEIKEDDIFFNYQLQTGRAKTRNAIKLLGIIGYESEIIDSAEILAK